MRLQSDRSSIYCPYWTWQETNQTRYRNFFYTGSSSVFNTLRTVALCSKIVLSLAQLDACCFAARVLTGENARSLVLVSVSADVFQRCLSTRKWPFCFLGQWSRPNFKQIFSVRVKTLSKSNQVAWRHIKRENAWLPLDVRCSNSPLLKLPTTEKATPTAHI